MRSVFFCLRLSNQMHLFTREMFKIGLYYSFQPLRSNNIQDAKMTFFVVAILGLVLAGAGGVSDNNPRKGN